MNEKLKEAFEQVQAESELKSKTKDFIFQKTNGYKRGRIVAYKHLISGFACMVLLLIGGRWLYFTPTVEIGIDINPSVELGVNRFNRIISFEGYNDDGRELINSLDIKFMNYSEAVNKIIESEDIVSLLSNDEIMTIAVIGTDSTQAEEILSTIQSCTTGRNNTYCYYAHSEEVEMAHQAGLSYGKYKAFLQLQALEPNITVDEIQNMTMREIRDRISKLSNDGENEANHFGGRKGYRENSNGQGKKNGQGGNKGRATKSDETVDSFACFCSEEQSR